MRMKMISKTNTNLSIVRQCRLLDINRASFYYHPLPDGADAVTLMNEIQDIWERYPFYGYRRITATLQRSGYKVNHKKVQRMMRKMGIQAIYPKPRLSIANTEHKKYPYLLNDFSLERADQVWATDITYIKMNPGFVYLVAIIDLYSRYVVSWRLSISLDAGFCIEALEAALIKGQPDIFNTDQGCQFTSAPWIAMLEAHHIQISMDGKGRCMDNIYVERLWRSFKYEEVYLKSYESVYEARKSIASYVEFYNYHRPHQALRYKTPAEVYFKNRPNSTPDGDVDNLLRKFPTSPQAQQQQIGINLKEKMREKIYLN
jgi:putative transposase